ncbi:hypothetical protein AGABI1DRAFT_126424 [Agaricus bisporus var. burnettii JB137-S8]|uniref:Uncharacterized protein n=1 Tax=Agaricus bisporus var. burnettii (strain JB137-S8 / ATCC MYA-4627 / FGSC 10392) TaxID=597362 RepID=K5Y2J2_AGABU|nr:uncharacterized protein AGABI1DRAFT_126424 [Agaricus bisporus var. burnettii JB137-S8]EKM82075.1 hypothetical protein AGABI1DRAFT_126424 [Agaricus bisporus var. burnettii JB137-S8]
MTSSQPLVCTSLHLPPDLEPFLRIHEISLHVFLPNLDRLRLALEADPDPQAINIFFGTRKVSREKIQQSFRVLHLAQGVAYEYSKVLKALSEKKPTQELLLEAHIQAYTGMGCSKKAQQAMGAFRRELESAVSQVTAIMNNKYRKGSKSSLTSTENTQAVSEVLSAIDECNELLKQCHNQFAELATHTQDEGSIDSNPPSEEEPQLMRAKWQTFYDNIRDVWIHGYKVADEILMPTFDNPPNAPEKRKCRQIFPSWRTLFQLQDKRELVRSTSGIAESLDATLSNGPASKVPFWRRIYQRTNRNNSTLHTRYPCTPGVHYSF